MSITPDKVIGRIKVDDQFSITRHYTERAVKFLRESKDRPFFLYLPHVMPHVPIFASDKFKGRSARGLYGDVVEELDAAREAGLQATNDSEPALSPARSQRKRPPNARRRSTRPQRWHRYSKRNNRRRLKSPPSTGRGRRRSKPTGKYCGNWVSGAAASWPEATASASSVSRLNGVSKREVTLPLASSWSTRRV